MPVDSSSDVTGSYETVEEYVNSDELQSQLAELKSSLSESGMSIDIKAEGNALIYVYTYETIAKADFDDSMVQTLETGLDDQQTHSRKLQTVSKKQQMMQILL